MVATEVNAAIEHGDTGLWYGRIILFPGTHARASSRQSLVDELQCELDYHLDWLRYHGEDFQVFDSMIIEIAEEITEVSQLGESGGETAFFELDKQIVDERQLDKLLRLMGHNRQDLTILISNLSSVTMNEIPSGKGRSITGILQHICNAEEFYVSRLGKEADTVYEEYLNMTESEASQLPVLERLDVVRKACSKTLRYLAPAKNDGVLTRSDYTKHPNERWSLYKVLRRFLEHEREHIYNIREYLGIEPRTPESQR